MLLYNYVKCEKCYYTLKSDEKLKKDFENTNIFCNEDLNKLVGESLMKHYYQINKFVDSNQNIENIAENDNELAKKGMDYL